MKVDTNRPHSSRGQGDKETRGQGDRGTGGVCLFVFLVSPLSPIPPSPPLPLSPSFS
ncbi:hypothetical protein [Tolypothrix sp. VBCCA 56010]|uniref:hypothetical protein n=1 Tax=Tolypothrix sp. VBCCA 56010 TaxID=3137731 RepID=UPI003D7DA791